MNSSTPTRMVMIGCGSMARHHIRAMMQTPDTTQIVGLVEPSAQAYEALCVLMEENGLEAPPNQPDLKRFLAEHRGQVDAAFIITPHALHYKQTVMCLEAGLDVLLEKPMVVTAEEAEKLIALRDQTGRLLVVAFQGSLSPQIRAAAKMLRAGDLGVILNISAMVWQDWDQGTAASWRQQPKLSGGGFLFDTGAHMLNTVADLAGEDFVEVAAWLMNDGRPVDIRAAVMARLRSGALVTMNACGKAIPSCNSEVYLFCEKAIVRTGIWGEHLEIQYDGEERFHPVEVESWTGPWEQFLAVRSGKMANPSPPEVGLRMARLWDAIQVSAEKNGLPVRLG